MNFHEAIGSLARRVTRRFHTVVGEPERGGTTAVSVKPETDDDLPIGFPGPAGGAWKYYEERTKLLKTRKDLYEEYDEMDEESPEFSSALDIYADNATKGSSSGEVSIILKSEDPRVSRIITDIRDRLCLDKIVWTLARDIAKYGERAEEVIVNSNFDISRLKPLPTAYIIPQIDEYGLKKSPAYIQIDDEGKTLAEFEDWQILHFANKKSRSDLTGRGVGYAARKPFKQLRMMEDAIVIARLTRAHNRLAYLVDTGQMTPKEAQDHLKKVKAFLRKRRTIDPRTNKMDLTWNPLSIEEDVFVAVNKDSRADVKVLQGDLTIGNLDDLTYFQQKQFTAYKVPKVYLTYDKDTRTRAVVSESDIQFARSVRRIQHVIHDGFRKLFDFGLSLKGIDPSQVTYTVALPPISVVNELREWQTWQLKMLVSRMFKETFWPGDKWLLKNLLGYDDLEVDELLKTQKKPDEYNGLINKPKTGEVANNMKTREDAIHALSQLPREEFEAIAEAADNLRMLLDWEREGVSNGLIHQ